MGVPRMKSRGRQTVTVHVATRDPDRNEYRFRFRYRLRDIGKFGFRSFPDFDFFGFGNFFSGNFGFRSLYSLNLWNRKATIVSIYIYRLFVSWPQPWILIFLGGAKTEECRSPQTTGRRIEIILDVGVEISKNRIYVTSRNRRRVGGNSENRTYMLQPNS